MGEGLITSGTLAQALLKGDAQAVVRERLQEQGLDSASLSFRELEEAVSQHVDAQEMLDVLKAGLQQLQGIPIDYGWVGSNGKSVARTDADARLIASPTAQALYWSLDGDVEHIDAFLATLGRENIGTLSRIVSQAALKSHTVDQLHTHLSDALEGVFSSLVDQDYHAGVNVLAKLLDAADVLNDVSSEGRHLRALRERHEETLMQNFLERGLPETYRALSDLGATEGLQDLVCGKLSLAIAHKQPVSTGLVRAAASTGVNRRGYESLRSVTSVGTVRVHEAVHGLLESQDRRDWDLGLALASSMDEVRGKEYAECTNEVLWHLRAKIAALDVHDCRRYAQGIIAGLGKGVAWQAMYTSARMEAGSIKRAAVVSSEYLHDLVFCDDARFTSDALRVVDAVVTPNGPLKDEVLNAYLMLGRQGFAQGRTHPSVARVAQHYGLSRVLVENAIRHAVQNKMILTEMVDVALREDALCGGGERIAPRLIETYRTCVEELVCGGATSPVHMENALEFARNYGVSEGFAAVSKMYSGNFFPHDSISR